MRQSAAALLALGTTAVATQIILLREFLAVFQGNELVIGVVLSCWMMLTAAGALLGSRLAGRSGGPALIPAGLLALGILPVVTVFSLRMLRNLLFTAGSMVPVVQTILLAGLLLIPFCLLSGAGFTLFTAQLPARTNREGIAAGYFWESLGSVTAGVLFTLVLLPRVNTFQALWLLLAFDAVLASAIAFRRVLRLPATLSLLIAVGACAAAVSGSLDALSRGFLFPGQEIALFRDTPYGNLTVTRQEGQTSLFENGVLLFSTGDAAANEENVHYAMIQRPSARSVLLIGGGIAGTTQEILKYGVERLDYAEMNPWVLEIGRSLTDALDDRRIHLVTGDSRAYVRRATQRYNVVLVNLPDPETIQLNRFYTEEFFRELKRVLADSGVVSISLLPGTEYLGPEARSTSSVLFATLAQVFHNVRIVPGMRNYFLASDGGLNIEIGRLIEEHGIATAYVNRYYLDDRMLAQRSAGIRASLDSSAPVNTDFEPISYYRQIAYWLSYFGAMPPVWILLVVAAVAVLLTRTTPVGIGMFTAGCVAISLEILVLLVFQTMAGALYSMTGLVIAAFMAGLAGGSALVRWLMPDSGRGMFTGLLIAIGILCLLLPPFFVFLQGADLSSGMLEGVFAVLALVVAFPFGMQFAVAAALRSGPLAAGAAEIYGLDLAGSAVGALVVTVYAIPLIGVGRVSVVLSAASALAALVFLRNRR